MWTFLGLAAVPTTALLLWWILHRRMTRSKFKRDAKSEFAGRGTRWDKSQHEYHVEKFYETGLTGKHDFHGGYLNFGFWVNGNKDYIKASEELLSRVVDPIGYGPDSEHLDVANGMGAQDIYFFNKYKPKSIDMVDITLSHHLICKKRIEEHGLSDRLHAHYGSAMDLPFGDKLFTHVTCVEGGAHFPVRERFFEEAFRVLKPGGRLGLADYARPKYPTNIFEYVVAIAGAKFWNAPKRNWYPPEEFKEHMEKAGFVDVVVTNVGEYTIPGYYEESMKARAELRKIRGWFTTYVLCRVLDELCLWLYNRRVMTYVLAHGRKPE